LRYLTIILWLCLTTVCLAQTPVDFQKWQLDDTTFQVRIGDPIQNYSTDTSWAEIENDFVLIGDTMTARHAYMKTDVLPNGISRITIEHNDTTYTITQRPVKLIWLNTATWNWIDVEGAPSWSTPSVDSNIIKWTGVFPGVDYRIRKQKARVEHGIFFKPAFLDSAVILYNQRADSLDIALGNVMEYTLSANIDNADIGVGNVNKRILKRIGKHVFGLAASRLHFPGSDTLQGMTVNHRWVKKNSKIYCIEYIKMRKIKIIHEAYPNATIWHNASPHTIDGTTNVEDTYIFQWYGNRNYGGSDWLRVGDNQNLLVRVKNVASELGPDAMITSCICSLYAAYDFDAVTLRAFVGFKPWGEGSLDDTDPPDAPVGEGVATWNDWSNDDEEWATAGCNNGDDEGTDNSGDGTGADRKATEESSVTTNGDNGVWYGWIVSNVIAQAWYEGTKNEEGIYLWEDTSYPDVAFRSTEYSSNQPFWVFTYTVGEPPALYPFLKE